ncbi:fucose permease [Cryobacterium psychrophilum]|uniref:MFS transporter n=1 Tax=Cryobacterium psychrophilum TaxID=41988 RepID=A0A4Y8KSC2_9MICO|nr:MFS transporter [Cryobacterium psychrophilum]TDW30259.1 fucose permease [Cryobacterium psychrophilum]TFD77479.1 MFS transporter [Cryobacterium psychrophilum]
MPRPVNARPTPSPARHALFQWRNAVFATFFVNGLGLASWMSRIPAVRDRLGLDTTQVGLLIFGLSAGSVIGLILAAWLLARLGARRAMTLSMSLAAAGLVLMGAGVSLFPSAPFVFGALAVFGFGIGSLDVMMNVEGAAAEREVGRTLMPLMHACFSLGTVMGALGGAVASVLRVSVFWHLAFIAILVLGTVVAAVRFLPLRHDLGDDAPAEPAGSWRERLAQNLTVWRDRKLLLIGMIVLGMTFAEGSANDWLALAAVDGHGFSNASGAIVFGVFVSAMTVGRVLGGPVLDRYGRVAVLRASAAVGIVGLILFILAPAAWLVYVGTVLWGLGASLGFPVGMSAAADDARNAAARVSAVAMIGYFAFLVGPPVLGLLGDAWGVLNALYVILALMVLAGLAAPAARPAASAARS